MPEDYGFIIRLVLPEDEAAGALAPRPWSAIGAPLREFTEPVDAVDRFAPLGNTHFADCAGCLNRADPQVDLREPHDAVKKTFDAARARWQTDRAQYVAGGLDEATMTARRGFLGARSLADVQGILDSLP